MGLRNPFKPSSRHATFPRPSSQRNPFEADFAELLASKDRTGTVPGGGPAVWGTGERLDRRSGVTAGRDRET